ncbi:type II toxin -antitoxin system TacA 1-like antitoxin [Providencia manganoxydans]|uniref:type II toxin -antitoxin system TacA 1-like antitoxin n=1 Tax=Providencia manganoxydans TaxID=2923283 RepID=UPI0034E3C1C0
MIITLNLKIHELNLLKKAANRLNVTVEQFILEAAKSQAQQVLHKSKPEYACYRCVDA